MVVVVTDNCGSHVLCTETCRFSHGKAQDCQRVFKLQAVCYCSFSIGPLADIVFLPRGLLRFTEAGAPENTANPHPVGTRVRGTERMRCCIRPVSHGEPSQIIPGARRV